MTLYILNTSAIPLAEAVSEADVKLRRITVSEAKQIISLASKVVSAVGHEATAKLLSQILSYPVECNRIAISMHPGDSAIHFVLKTRLPEGKILSLYELERLEYSLIYSQVLLPP